jgi:hypothetical protein
VSSETLSNRIRRACLPEGGVASYQSGGIGSWPRNRYHTGSQGWSIKSHRWLKQLEDINHSISFQRSPKTILKHYLAVYLFKIASLIHIRDWAVIAWISLYTSQICIAEGGQEFRQLAFRIARAPFNSHLCCGLWFLSTREYRLPGVVISQHRSLTLRGIFPGVVV